MAAVEIRTVGGDQPISVVQTCSVPADPLAEASSAAQTKARPPRLADTLLLIYADALDDFERTRIATENRARALRQTKELAGTPEEHRMLAMCEALQALEHQAELELKRALRVHPFGPWVKAIVGIGEKQGARLLAAIGDPYWNALADRPRRGPAELWAYCGYHVLHPDHVSAGSHGSGVGVDLLGSDHEINGDHQPIVGADPFDTSDHTNGGTQYMPVAGVAPRPSRGQRGNWNRTAKMRAYLCAEACMKNRQSPYRKVYEDGREKYADAVHQRSCHRCGPAGKPAHPGSPLNDGHKHARALRLVAKAILADLWAEGKRLAARPQTVDSADGARAHSEHGARTQP